MTAALDVAASAAELRVALADLKSMDDGPRVRLALAECEFRLALADGVVADERIALLRSATSRDPYLVKGYLHLGRLLHLRGRYRAAAVEYLAALDLAPTSRRVHLLLAEALCALDADWRTAGEALLTALAVHDPEPVAAAVARVADLLAADGAPAAQDDKKDAEPRGRPAKAPADLSGIWGLWLLTRLNRPERGGRANARRAAIDACVRAAAATPGTAGAPGFAIAGVLALLSSAEFSPADLRKAAEAAGVELVDPADPPSQALAAALELVESSDPTAFMAAAAGHLAAGALPVVAVCLLHFDRFGPSAGQSVAEALRMVDGYPVAFQDDSSVRELRIALLDGYARESQSRGSFAHARGLWREATALDPQRVPAVCNLALLAARERSVAEYEPAWERLFELLYLLAAGIGDPQMELVERRDLHLALARQARQHHCDSLRSGGTPTGAQLEAWIRDPDTLAVWLREWDAFYINARLSFRSPIHLLGVARDAPSEAVTEARDALVRQLDAMLVERAWAGGGAFRALAVAAVEDAFAKAAEPVERTRDRYFEREKAKADTLATEVVQRVVTLLSLLHALARMPVSAVRAGLAAEVVRRQAGLAPTMLQTLFVDRGLRELDSNLAEEVEIRVTRIAQCWDRAQPDSEPDRSRTVARLDELAGALPACLDLHLYQARARLAAERPAEAYAVAVEALTRSVGASSDEQATDLRVALIDLIDRIAFDDVPESVRHYDYEIEAEQTARAREAALARYPASAALRASLAWVHLELDRVSGRGRQRAVAEIVIEGVVDALDDRQVDQLEEVLDRLAGFYAAEAVRAATTALLTEAASGPQDAVTVARRITRCLHLASRFELEPEAAALDAALADLAGR
jgi:hypothetical protein